MIVICYDGSEDAKAAIDQAAKLFPNMPATVLTVWEPFVEIVGHGASLTRQVVTAAVPPTQAAGVARAITRGSTDRGPSPGDRLTGVRLLLTPADAATAHGGDQALPRRAVSFELLALTGLTPEPVERREPASAAPPANGGCRVLCRVGVGMIEDLQRPLALGHLD